MSNKKLIITAAILFGVIVVTSQARADDFKIVYKNNSGIVHFGPGLSNRYYKERAHRHKKVHKRIHKKYHHKRAKHKSAKIVYTTPKYYERYYYTKPIRQRYAHAPRGYRRCD